MDTKQYLKNTYSAYQNKKEGISFAEKHRYCGAMECALVHLGILSPNQKFEYQSIKIKWFFGLFTEEIKETYIEMIERLVGNFLTIAPE